MSRLTETFTNIFKIQELRERLLFTAALLVVVRIGSHITLPGVDARVLADYMRRSTEGTLFGLYDLFVGGAFSNAAIFALGIMPYISSSIVIQLLGAVVPYFQKLQKEGEDGRKKITQYTRYGTVFICLLQGSGVVVKLQSTVTPLGPIVPVGVSGFGFALSTILILTAGTVFMMWLGEQITEKGIGNGISLIIFIGIIARFPASLLDEYQLILGGRNIIVELVILVLMGFIVASVVLVTQGTRRIPVQYAKRVIGRKVYGGVTQYIPLRVNTAGVMPIIFAQAIMFVPQIFFQFFPESEFVAMLSSEWFSYDSWTYSFVYGLMIVFFTYFYTAIAFNPRDVADNM
ncbi:MAG: preprotein translocase subunit SecY, partial [Bacteroidota bacterium]